MKYYVESSRGAQAGTSNAEWTPWAIEYDSIEDALAEIIDAIASCHDREDRGEEYEAEWESLMDRAKSADVGDPLTFDERSWRIVEAV